MTCDKNDPKSEADPDLREDDTIDRHDGLISGEVERLVGLIESALGLPKGHFRKAIAKSALQTCSPEERDRQRHDLAAAFEQIDEPFSRRQIIDLVEAMARRRIPDRH